MRHDGSSFAFKSSPLRVFTGFSTFPFACGYLGPEVRCSNCQSVKKFLNSWLSNSGPLLLISSSGMPCRANCTLNWVIKACAVLLWISTTSNWTSSLHYQECLLPNDQQICGNFLPKAQRKFMWLKLLARLCWTVCLTDWTTRNKVSYFSTHSWLVQNFTSTANTSSNANVTTVELSWHVPSKWKCTSCFPRKTSPCDFINSFRLS